MDVVREPVLHRHRWIALAVILTVEVMDLLDALATNVAGPAIRAEIGGTYSLIQWLGAAYTLAMSVGLLTGGRLGDIVGRRRIFLIGAAGFTAASLACGLAQSPGQLIAARVVQGLFGAVMLPQGLGMIRQMFPPSESAKAFGAFGPVITLASVAGPTLAGWLVTADWFGAGWRMIFFINLPLGVFAVIGAIRFLPEMRDERAPRMDWLGVLMAAGGAFLLLFPLVQGRELGWPAWCLVMLAAGLATFGIFAVVQRRRERDGRDPLITPSLFRKRAFTGGLAFGLAFFTALIGTGLVLTIFLQVGLGYGPLQAGLTMLPQALGSVLGFVAAGAGLVARFGRRLLQAGVVLMAAGVVAFAGTVQLAGAALTPYAMIPSLFLIGAGMGLAMAPFFGIVLSGVDNAETGSAAGALTSVQQLGGAFGLAVLGTIFFAILPGQVGGRVDASADRLHAVLAAEGVPPSSMAAATAGLRACLTAHIHQTDPDGTPESCRRTDPPSPAVAAYAAHETRAGFRSAVIGTLGVTSVLLAAAFGLSFLLPRWARQRNGQ